MADGRSLRPPMPRTVEIEGRKLVLGLHVAWWLACSLVVATLIGARWLRYSGWSPPGLEPAMREIMVLEQQAFLWPWAYGMLHLRTVLLALVIAALALHRRLPGRLARRDGGVWRLTPLAVSLAAGVLLWANFLLDLNPFVALLCASGIVLATIAEWDRVTDVLPRLVLPVTWGAFFALGLFASGDVVERLVVVVWGIALLATHRWLAPRMRRPDLMLLRVLGMAPMNLLATALPLVAPLHGGTHLGDGLAYSFCESPDRGILYAAIPVCSSVSPSYEECREGRIVEYDLGSMQAVASHSFFSPEFHGRLELLECLDDEVQVAVQAATYQGREVVQGVLYFPVAAPRNFTLLMAEGGLGTTIGYDRKNDVFFYSGEFNNPVVRYDRRTRQFDASVGEEFRRRWIQPVQLRVNNGSLALYTHSIHPGRNRLYLVDWMQGRYAYALDLASLHVAARYDVGGGGSLGVAVDPERDRLYVSSLWGLEVFDLETDELIARKRLGLGNRSVVVDAPRNRLYVSSMVEGKIRILDRDTLETIGQIPIGFGSRYLHLTRDGKHLVASSASAHFYWDADTLLPSPPEAPRPPPVTTGSLSKRAAPRIARIPQTMPEPIWNATEPADGASPPPAAATAASARMAARPPSAAPPSVRWGPPEGRRPESIQADARMPSAAPAISRETTPAENASSRAMMPRSGANARTRGSSRLSGWVASKRSHAGRAARVGTNTNTSTACPMASATAPQGMRRPPESFEIGGGVTGRPPVCGARVRSRALAARATTSRPHRQTTWSV